MLARDGRGTAQGGQEGEVVAVSKEISLLSWNTQLL
jgi:hypothetical protein